MVHKDGFMHGAFGGLLWSGCIAFGLLIFMIFYGNRRPPWPVLIFTPLQLMIPWTLLAGLVGAVKKLVRQRCDT